jgi:high-affinity iron transporter
LLSNFLIALREGLEASLIVGILVAYVVKTGRGNRLRFIWLGVGSAVAFSLSLGGLLAFTAHSLPARFESIFAGSTSLAAVALVTWMVFWMRRTAFRLRADLHERLSAAIGPVALTAVAFLAVSREGIETSLFLYTNAKAAGTNSDPLIGLLIGFALAIALGWAVFNRAIHLDIGRFFAVTGVGLIVVAAGVLSHGIGDLQGTVTKHPSLAFDLHRAISENSALAHVLAGTIGFSPVTTILQACAWAIYLLAVLFLYLRKPARATSGQPELAKSDK